MYSVYSVYGGVNVTDRDIAGRWFAVYSGVAWSLGYLKPGARATVLRGRRVVTLSTTFADGLGAPGTRRPLAPA